MTCCIAAMETFHLAGYLAGLLAAATALTIVFRRVRLPGDGVLAGAVAGFLLGPTLLGRMAPDWFERVVIGGQEERQALDLLKGEHEARELARREFGLAPLPLSQDSALQESEENTMARELRTKEAWRAAQWRDRKAARILTIGFAGLFFVAAALTRPPKEGPRPHFYQATSIGIWSAILPGSLFVVALRWLDVDLAGSFAAGSAIAAGALTFARGDFMAADEAEVGGARLIVAASRIAMLAAILTLFLVVLAAHGIPQLVLVLPPLMALAAAWLLPRLHGAYAAHARDSVLVPWVTALLAMRIEFFEHLSLWMIVTAIILSGDGRWFGAFLGAMLSGVRRSLRTMRLVLGVMSAGPAQIAFAAIALHAGLIGEQPAYALLAGAVVMELTTNARRGMAQRIEETEEEMEQLSASAD